MRWSMLGLGLVISVALSVSVPPEAVSAAPFRVRAAADDVPAPFTLAVIPDTQKYVETEALAPTAQAQTQWVVDHASDLNIAFTVQVGDLVESWPNTSQWDRISSAFATLDDHSVPYSVLPGNHDIDFTTGNAPTYDQYFPVSRFRDASWNSPTARFGGHLGSNSFGPDPVDRRGMDTFDLFSAGGLDWLLLNLEFESPGYALTWAQKVIDAYPGRRVILATHGFVDTRGWRTNDRERTDPGTKTSNEVWNELVYRNCSVDFVLSGHYHAGDLGEGRRTDANACGEPVFQLASDYQDRPAGGDGWLRYYTFDPAQDTVDAFTYSVTKRTFENDADSRFTLSYDLSPDASTTDDVVVPGGSTWKWRNQQGAWPTGWDTAGYDDSSWSSGRAPLGFNAGMVATGVDLGPPSSNRVPTILFRRAFDLDDLGGVGRLRLVTKADDGLVVRVNGREVGRTSVPAGPAGPTTYASAAPRSMAAPQVVYDVPLSLLRPSGNVIAASTHLNYLATTDVHFDLVAVATRSEDAPPTPASEDVTLVDDVSSWRWQFDTAAWPSGWTTTGYDASGWSQGPAPLGFGAPVNTNIDVPAPTSNRPRSALFRRAFEIDDVSRYSDVLLTTRADDGLLLTVNGTEVNRTRAPTGTLSASSYATAAPSTSTATSSPVTVPIPTSLLHDGTNVIAAATLLNYRGTPNATFAARLTAVHTLTTGGSAPAAPALRVDSTTPDGVRLGWAAASGDVVTGWTLTRDGTALAQLPGGTTSFADAGLTPATTYSYTLTATNDHGTSPPSTVSATTASSTRPLTLVRAASTWRYVYSSSWPTGWTTNAFDDAAWKSGPAPLGFGSVSIATNLDVPPPTSSRPLGALLRTGFEVADRARISDLVLTTRADDGVVVYVNGQELGRSNVAPGPVGPTTYATAAPRTTKALQTPLRWQVPTSMLVDGHNTIAAVCLVNYRATPDLSFDLSLTGSQSN